MVLGFIFASNFGMLAPQNNTNDITDALSGSLTTWYQNVDSALKASECVPGYYEHTHISPFTRLRLSGDMTLKLVCASQQQQQPRGGTHASNILP